MQRFSLNPICGSYGRVEQQQGPPGFGGNGGMYQQPQAQPQAQPQYGVGYGQQVQQPYGGYNQYAQQQPQGAVYQNQGYSNQQNNGGDIDFMNQLNDLKKV